MIGWYVFFLEKHPLTQTMFHAFSDLAKGRIQFQTKKHLKRIWPNLKETPKPNYSATYVGT